MRGHVRRRKKLWVFIIDEGRDENGRRKQKWSRGYTTRREAEVELRKALGRVDVGQDPFPERILVSEFIDRLIDHWNTNNKPGPRTRREYERLLRQRVVPAIGGHELAKVKPAHIQHVIDTAVAEGVKPPQLRAVMSTAFEQAVRWSLIPTNPARATTAPSKARPKLVVPNAQQLRELIDVARGTPWEIAMLIAATCGRRRSETLGLTWDCADLGAGTVKIERTLQRIGGKIQFAGTKTERSKRTIPLPGFAVARLREHRARQMRRRLEMGGAWTDLDLVVERGDGAPLDPDAFSKAVPRLAASIGLPGCRAHDIRHGVATTLAKSGARPEVTSALMGHASTSFTQSVYMHPDAEQLEAAMRSVEEAFGQ